MILSVQKIKGSNILNYNKSDSAKIALGRKKK